MSIGPGRGRNLSTKTYKRQKSRKTEQLNLSDRIDTLNDLSKLKSYLITNDNPLDYSQNSYINSLSSNKKYTSSQYGTVCKNLKDNWVNSNNDLKIRGQELLLRLRGDFAQGIIKICGKSSKKTTILDKLYNNEVKLDDIVGQINELESSLTLTLTSNQIRWLNQWINVLNVPGNKDAITAYFKNVKTRPNVPPASISVATNTIKSDTNPTSERIGNAPITNQLTVQDDSRESKGITPSIRSDSVRENEFSSAISLGDTQRETNMYLSSLFSKVNSVFVGNRFTPYLYAPKGTPNILSIGLKNRNNVISPPKFPFVALKDVKPFKFNSQTSSLTGSYGNHVDILHPLNQHEDIHHHVSQMGSPTSVLDVCRLSPDKIFVDDYNMDTPYTNIFSIDQTLTVTQLKSFLSLQPDSDTSPETLHKTSRIHPETPETIVSKFKLPSSNFIGSPDSIQFLNIETGSHKDLFYDTKRKLEFGVVDTRFESLDTEQPLKDITAALICVNLNRFPKFNKISESPDESIICLIGGSKIEQSSNSQLSILGDRIKSPIQTGNFQGIDSKDLIQYFSDQRMFVGSSPCFKPTSYLIKYTDVNGDNYMLDLYKLDVRVTDKNTIQGIITFKSINRLTTYQFTLTFDLKTLTGTIHDLPVITSSANPFLIEQNGRSKEIPKLFYTRQNPSKKCIHPPLDQLQLEDVTDTESLGSIAPKLNNNNINSLIQRSYSASSQGLPPGSVVNIDEGTYARYNIPYKPYRNRTMRRMVEKPNTKLYVPNSVPIEIDHLKGLFPDSIDNLIISFSSHVPKGIGFLLES